MTTLDFATPIQALIPAVEERMRSQSNGYRPELRQALDQLLVSGGKRVRPTVALLVAAMFGVEQERAITLAAAVELLHTATLVHDDFIDGALLRRGTPTLNAQWNSAATVLAGDFLFSQAAGLAADVESNDVMRMFAKTLSTIVNGEIGQVFSLNGPSTREEYYERIYAKTASMFELAARAPAFLSSDAQGFGEPLQTFGREIGLAFQIVDDILDFSSDTATIGKPAANDLRQGLLTLPALYFLEDHPEREDLRLMQEDKLHDAARVDALIEEVRSSDAMKRAQAKAEAHRQASLEALDALPDTPERQALVDLTEYVVARLN
ncbi:MAG: polyprenyl synthetase family protein [Chloroflexi bacterium]|nr:polyprenyl synthetase family protein [Chloroflexota bacterium]